MGDIYVAARFVEMKLTMNEMRTIVHEVVSERKQLIFEVRRKRAVLEERKERIGQLMSEKSSLLDRIGSKLGVVNPSLDVDDPTKAKKAIDRSLGAASKLATGFQASSLNTTRAINQFHTAVKDSMDKVLSLSDTLGPDRAADYQKKLVELVRNFYSLLKSEADRIDTYLKTISADLESKGLDKRLPYMNTKGLKGKKEAPKRPASSTFRTDVDEPTEPSNKSFRTNVG